MKTAQEVPLIRVGLITDGRPEVTPLPDGRHRIGNLLIGKDFHWERTIAITTPGEIETLNETETRPDRVTLILTLPIESYLKMVVGSEMNPLAPSEFLKAHAILSRSWALGKILHSHPEGHEGKLDTDMIHIGWDDTADHHGFDVCSDDHCQRFQGESPLPRACAEAIEATRGLVLTDSQGHVVDARFSKCCGGRSERFSTCWQDMEPPCIESVEDSWCDYSGLDEKTRRDLTSAVMKDYDLATSDFHDWEERVPKSLVGNRIRTCLSRDIGDVTSIMPLKRGVSGRISLLRVSGTKGSIDVGKELHIRRILSESHLKSSWFDAEDTGDSLTLKGHGWGHGVGLCQMGAARMALAHGYEDILKFYFPHAEIRDIISD